MPSGNKPIEYSMPAEGQQPPAQQPAIPAVVSLYPPQGAGVGASPAEILASTVLALDTTDAEPAYQHSASTHTSRAQGGGSTNSATLMR